MNRYNYSSIFLDNLRKKEGTKSPSGNAGARVATSTPQKKSGFKQYGDKGYKPSTGKGVGY